MPSEWEAMELAGLLPVGVAVASLPACGDDLLGELGRVWSEAAGRERGSTGGRCRRIAERLRAWQQRGSRLTLGIPDLADRPFDPWLGLRLAWWPAGLPSGRKVGLVSSRLGRDLETRRRWFAALRAACMSLDHDRDVLVTARSISTQKFVQRAGALFGVRVLEVDVWDQPDRDAARWGVRLLESDPADDAGPALVLSPPYEPSADESLTSETPAADRAVVALSDRLIVLSARPGGNVDRLVARRLAARGFPAASVFVALGDELVPRELAEPWMDAGAVGWYLQDAEDPQEPAEEVPWRMADSPRQRGAPVRRLAAGLHGDRLTHWTRRRGGPWPDEREADYLDDLILDRGGADHSAFAALWRIVQTRRLIATGDLVRGAAPVVCFTEVPLAELQQHRLFRPHLARWDFEPFGISIDRSWLQQHGAQAVRYGDQELWESLSDEQRPFFQKRTTLTRNGHLIDWSAEREWRHRGDMALDEVPPESALVFVPTLGHARQIAAISPWPVIVLD
jgi:hypothetical protein